MRSFRLRCIVFFLIFAGLINIQLVFPQTEETGSIYDLLSETGRIIPDPANNSIMVIDHAPNIEKIEEYLRMVDRPSQQILIEARVVEVNLDEESAMGVTWKSWIDGGKVLGYHAGAPITLGSAPGSGAEQQIPWLGSTPAFPAGAGRMMDLDPFTLGIFSDNIEVIFKALTTQFDTNLLSAPKIVTKNNLRATINVAKTIPYVGSVEREEDPDTGRITYSYEYEYADEGVNLEVTPLVNSDGTITLDLRPEVKEVDITTLTGLDGQALPITDVRVAETKITLKDGQTAVIGGLIREKGFNQTAKVPFLGDIPLLGHFFRSTYQRKEKTELVILVSPRIVGTRYQKDSGKREEALTEELAWPKKRETIVEAKEEELKRARQEKLERMYAQGILLYNQREYQQAYEVFYRVRQLSDEYSDVDRFLEFIPKRVVEKEGRLRKNKIGQALNSFEKEKD